MNEQGEATEFLPLPDDLEPDIREGGDVIAPTADGLIVTCGHSSPNPAIEARFRALRQNEGYELDTGCDKRIGDIWLYGYRCTECARWMHRECAERHFAEHGAVAVRQADAPVLLVEIERLTALLKDTEYLYLSSGNELHELRQKNVALEAALVEAREWAVKAPHDPMCNGHGLAIWGEWPPCSCGRDAALVRLDALMVELPANPA